MNDPKADFIREHRRGEMPRHQEWNAMAAILNRTGMQEGEHIAGPFRTVARRGRAKSVRLRHEAVVACPPREVRLLVDHATGGSDSQPLVKSNLWAAGVDGNSIAIINGSTTVEAGDSGRAYLADTPTLAKCEGTVAVGDNVGPTVAGTPGTLMKAGSGFRVVARGSSGTLWWVVRLGGVGYGGGTCKDDAGTLESVTFFQGFDTSSAAGELSVSNPFSDTLEVGLYATFIWNGTDYQIADIECT